MTCRNSCRDESTSSSSSTSLSTSSSLSAVASELEALRLYPSHDGEHFPPACRSLLLSLPGNTHCADCGSPKPEWANVSYGIMLCVQCSGRHRSHGVQNSRVRSIDMDFWNQPQILAMLEGGNHQLGGFFARHQMQSAKMIGKRYLTKAALFYRSHLQKHIQQVATAGVYEGREAARRRSLSVSSSVSSTSSTSSDGESLQKQSMRQNPIQQPGIAAN